MHWLDMTTEGILLMDTTITLEMAKSLADVTNKRAKNVVDFTVLQLNDVYEAGAVEGGHLGSLARVATLRRQLEKENPNLMTILSGDFLSPSPIGATTGDGGLHMIEALNAMGLNYVTIGNHEFDVTEADFNARIQESKFKWIVSNVTNVTNGQEKPFDKVDKNAVIEYKNAKGDSTVRVALIGLCLDAVKKPWVKYQNPIDSAREQVALLDGKADVFLAMTHLTMEDDQKLGTEVPRLDVLFGGHEHDAASAIVGDDATPIFKADSNARTVFVHRFRFNPKTRKTLLYSQLVRIDDSIQEEPETAAILKKWETLTFDTLRAQGIDPQEVVGTATEPLDGYEAAVRSRPTNLTQLIAETFLNEVPGADAAVLTSGTIRIDGIIAPGDITNFDVVRIFPLGGKLSVLKLPGGLLRALLNAGDAAKGTGGFQVRANITRDADGTLRVKGTPLQDSSTYTIVMNEIPMAAFAFPPFKGSGATKAFDTRDVRAILTDRFRRDRAALKPA